MKKIFKLFSWLLILVFLINLFFVWKDAFEGHYPSGSHEQFQTINQEFYYTVFITKFDKPKDQLSKVNTAFIKFKETFPQYKDLILYRTYAYNNIKPWMSWKWYRYPGARYFLDYPYLDTSHNRN